MICKEILQHSILVETRKVLHERGFSKLKASRAKKDRNFKIIAQNEVNTTIFIKPLKGLT